MNGPGNCGYCGAVNPYPGECIIGWGTEGQGGRFTLMAGKGGKMACPDCYEERKVGA